MANSSRARELRSAFKVVRGATGERAVGKTLKGGFQAEVRCICLVRRLPLKSWQPEN